MLAFCASFVKQTDSGYGVMRGVSLMIEESNSC